MSGPRTIGRGGWNALLRVCSGGDGIIYATDRSGNMRRNRDPTQDGTADVIGPQIIGRGGWDQFQQLFARGGDIHVVASDGTLRRYKDVPGDDTIDLDQFFVSVEAGWGSLKVL
jgi:hypothetical protein